jgi:hypothetical protein
VAPLVQAGYLDQETHMDTDRLADYLYSLDRRCTYLEAQMGRAATMIRAMIPYIDRLPAQTAQELRLLLRDMKADRQETDNQLHLLLPPSDEPDPATG